MSFDNEEMAREFATGEQFPIQEPFMSHIDNNLLALIEFYSTDRDDHKAKFPGMKKYIGVLTHLHRSANLSRIQAKQAYFKVKNEVVGIDKIRYAGDDEAIALLDSIEFNIWMILFGDAEGGKRGNLLARMVGSIREWGPLKREGAGGSWWRRR